MATYEQNRSYDQLVEDIHALARENSAQAERIAVLEMRLDYANKGGQYIIERGMKAETRVKELEAENARITDLYNQSLKLVHDSQAYEMMLLDGSDNTHAGVQVDDDEVA